MEQKIKDVKRRAAVVGPNMWMLFWLFIPEGIVNKIAESQAFQTVTWVHVLGLCLRVLCLVIPVLLLWRMTPASDLFRPAALGTAACALVDVATYILVPVSAVLIALSTLIQMYATYYEFRAYAQVMEDVDKHQSLEWQELWKIYLLLSAASLVFLLGESLNLGGKVVLNGLGGIVAVGACIYGIRCMMLFWNSIRTLREVGGEDGKPGFEVPKGMKRTLTVLLTVIVLGIIIQIAVGYNHLFSNMSVKEHEKDDPFPAVSGKVVECHPEEEYFILKVDSIDPYGYLMKVRVSTQTTSDRPCPQLEEGESVYITFTTPGDIKEPISARYISVFDSVSGEMMICKPGSQELEQTRDNDLSS